ncbi:MAG TPA: S8 family serine peptidase [Cytophagaceae bacterium]|nr:S8 family serine peptidase [Cytophagaceae bacterium]
MSIGKFTFIWLALLSGFQAGIQAQDIDYKKTRTSSSSVSTQKNDYIIPGIVVVKLKPEYRSLTNNLNALLGQGTMGTQLRKHKVEKFTKWFPNCKAPAADAKNIHNHKLTDLSLIHLLYFNPESPVQEVVSILQNSGLVEYAEPKFDCKIAYIPNDPWSAPGQPQELLYNRVNAYKAYDIEKGDTNVVIGVLDTGTELNHPDLEPNIKYNWADPIDGADNDNDGYVDNFYGWDLGSTAAIGGDNDPTWDVSDHGVMVQGSCSAMGDNNMGTCGTGFKCKSLPLKISNEGGALTAGYDAIIYAAQHGVKVMNLSWGGYGGYSQAAQDVINMAALDSNVLIIASAGNSEGELDFYPASFDNVISVSGLDTITSPQYDTLCEIRKTFNFGGYGMSYSFKVDLASLEGGVTTISGGSWGGFGGSSFASPTVAGAAALVRSKFPRLSSIQAGELLRATGDVLDTFDVTRPESRYKTGKKLNMYRALTDSTSPSVRMVNLNVKSSYGSTTNFFSGDTLIITNDFFNWLSGTNNLTIKMICLDGYATMVDSLSHLGVIDSLTGKSNTTDPFKILVNNNAGPSQEINLVMLMTDPSKNYYDYQGFKITVNPAFLDIDTNKVTVTVTSIGRIGYNIYETNPPSQGDGVVYSNNNLLYESGLMIAASQSQVSDCVRNYSSPDNDFRQIKSVRLVNPELKNMESYAIFDDSNSFNIIGVKIAQRSYAWKNTPNDHFVILEYQLVNQSSNTYDSLSAGLFADWDIGSYQYNRADWNDAGKVAYTYSVLGGYSVAGIAVLTDNPPSCYSLDNSSVGGNNINPNDGFTSTEKFLTLSQGVYRKQAGASGFGNDVSQVTGAKIYDFAPGDTETVAFAIIATDNIPDMVTMAQNARAKFVSIHQGPKPGLANVVMCNDTMDVTFNPGTGKYAFFNAPPPALPVHIGNSYTLTRVTNPDTIYIANADSLFYSDAETVYIRKDNMTLAFYPTTDTITLTYGPLSLINQSVNATSITWDLGDGDIETSNNVLHTYSADGFYKVSLIGLSTGGCRDTLSRMVNASGNYGMINGYNIGFFPNPVTSALNVGFLSNNYPEDASIEVINAQGKKIFSTSHVSQNTLIEMETYPSGVYYIKIRAGSGELNKKIIKD